MENLMLIEDIDVLSLLQEGLKYGLIISLSCGLLGQGLNYAIKLFTKNI